MPCNRVEASGHDPGRALSRAPIAIKGERPFPPTTEPPHARSSPHRDLCPRPLPRSARSSGLQVGGRARPGEHRGADGGGRRPAAWVARPARWGSAEACRRPAYDSTMSFFVTSRGGPKGGDFRQNESGHRRAGRRRRVLQGAGRRGAAGARQQDLAGLPQHQHGRRALADRKRPLVQRPDDRRRREPGAAARRGRRDEQPRRRRLPERPRREGPGGPRRPPRHPHRLDRRRPEGPRRQALQRLDVDHGRGHRRPRRSQGRRLHLLELRPLRRLRAPHR